MDNQRAKIILSAYRPNGADADDTLLSEALQLARLEPQLGQWLADQLHFDQKMCAAMRTILPPETLRAQILAAARTPKKSPGATGRAHARPRHSLKSAWIALVATVTLSLTGIFAYRASGPQPVAFAAITARILQVREELPGVLATHNADPKALQRWLAQHQGPSGFALPNGLSGKNSIGCQVFNIKGNRVSLICFRLDDKRVIHYFVMERSSLTDPPPMQAPLVQQKDGATLVSWSDSHRSYVLAEFSPDRELKSLL